MLVVTRLLILNSGSRVVVPLCAICGSGALRHARRLLSSAPERGKRVRAGWISATARSDAVATDTSFS
jgi:hypothetical protein